LQEEFSVHGLTFDRSSLTRWRQGMGEEQTLALLHLPHHSRLQPLQHARAAGRMVLVSYPKNRVKAPL
jgi:hypothetical protein